MMHLYIKRMLVAVLFVTAKKKKSPPPPPTKKVKHRERGKTEISTKNRTINCGMFVQRNYI